MMTNELLKIFALFLILINVVFGAPGLTSNGGNNSPPKGRTFGSPNIEAASARGNHQSINPEPVPIIKIETIHKPDTRSVSVQTDLPLPEVPQTSKGASHQSKVEEVSPRSSEKPIEEIAATEPVKPAAAAATVSPWVVKTRNILAKGAQGIAYGVAGGLAGGIIVGAITDDAEAKRKERYNRLLKSINNSK